VLRLYDGVLLRSTGGGALNAAGLLLGGSCELGFIGSGACGGGRQSVLLGHIDEVRERCAWGADKGTYDEQ